MASEETPTPPSNTIVRRPRKDEAADASAAPNLDDILDQAMAEAETCSPPADAEAEPEVEDDVDWAGDDIPDAPWAKSEAEAAKGEIAEEDLAAALNDSAGMMGAMVRRGDKVTGTVVHVGGSDIFVDIGGKSEAMLDADEMRDDSGKLTVAAGDSLTLYVASAGSDEVRLSYKMALEARSREAVRTAYAEHVPIEGRIAGQRKGGFDVKFKSGQRAFLPLSQLELFHIADEDLPEYVGKTYEFLITKYESDGKDLVVSRSQMLREERDQMRDELRQILEEGQIREGSVSRIVDFGAFVDLGGLDGLVHISEIQWGHAERPQDSLHPGDRVRVKVLRVDAANGKVSLSIKQAEGNPWDNVGSDFVEGQVYGGRVTRVEAYGAFVELAPGLEGLVHVSELAWERVRHPDSVVQPGEQVTVKLIRVDLEKRRLGLSIKALGGDPWNDVVPAWMRGQLIEGTVDKVAPFGVLVQLSPGITGLIPARELGMDQAQAHLAFQPGKTITVELAEVDSDRRRIRLLPSDEHAAGERAAVEDYRKEAKKANFGTLGDLLGGIKFDE